MDELERPVTRVQWLLGNQCNYQCSYCHENFRNGAQKFPSQELIAEVCKEIVYHFDDLGRNVVFEFIGGEPTLSGDVREIGKRLHNHPVNMVLKTNGSADIEWWANAKKYLSDVIISVHKEFCDIDHLDRVVSLLLENREVQPINVQILIPTTHDETHWAWAIETRKHFQRKFDIGNLQLLYSNFGKGSDMYYPYTDAQWEEYCALENISKPTRTGGNVLREQYVHKGQNCYAGIDILTIDPNGRIWRSWCGIGGPIGSIYELPLDFPKDPIVCDKLRCGNGFDRIARKD